MKPLKWPETDGDGHGQAGAVVEKRATCSQGGAFQSCMRKQILEEDCSDGHSVIRKC